MLRSFVAVTVLLCLMACSDDITGVGTCTTDAGRSDWIYIGTWEGTADGSCCFQGETVYPMQSWAGKLSQDSEDDLHYLLYAYWTDQEGNDGIAILNYYLQPGGWLVPAWEGGVYILDPVGGVYYLIGYANSSIYLQSEHRPLTGKWHTPHTHDHSGSPARYPSRSAPEPPTVAGVPGPNGPGCSAR